MSLAATHQAESIMGLCMRSGRKARSDTAQQYPTMRGAVRDLLLSLRNAGQGRGLDDTLGLPVKRGSDS